MRREIPSKVTMFGICRYKDLGQRFNRMNQPMIRKLRQALYADESKTQWSISFFYSEVIDKLYYSRIKMSRLIRCSITDTNRIISETINQYLKQNIL